MTTNRDVELAELENAVDACAFPASLGQVTRVEGLKVEALLPGARVGQRVEVRPAGGPPIAAEVALCDGPRVGLVPLGPTDGLGPGDAVRIVLSVAAIPCGPGLLGRVVDPFGRPLDGKPRVENAVPWPLSRPAPDPLTRPPVERQLVTGLRVIDGCLALGYGQRLGLFAGPGLGKTTLLGAMARRADCDACVICLVGERGREVRDFLDRALGPEGLARSVVLLAGPDASAALRARALESATAVAEWLRDQGLSVLLLVDSLTRVARARRDVALALGESPARGGYPSSVFAALPGLVERAGTGARGSITAVYAVLTEGPADRGDDPLAEEARSLFDGHLVLSARLAQAGFWPAVDLLASVSRVADRVVPPGQSRHAATLRRLIAAHQGNEDLILMGAYRPGSSPDTDLFLARRREIEAFLAQELDRPIGLADTRAALAALAG
ncbi:MAG TPA: FliI/YscN family ATPase [Polyangia bacterium]|nr:FliI/YscN family ATPase [Polyangia bacterium]